MDIRASGMTWYIYIYIYIYIYTLYENNPWNNRNLVFKISLYTLPMDSNGYISFLINTLDFFVRLGGLWRLFLMAAVTRSSLLDVCVGKTNVHVTRPTLLKALRPFTHALTLIRGVMLTTWYMRPPFFGRCIFGAAGGCLGYGPVPSLNVKNTLCKTRPVNWMYGK